MERPEVFWRTSGLNRPGLIARFTAPRLAIRLAMGIENVLAHAVVNRLLGFDRPFAETRLQLTPVEWGVWTFLILRALDSMGSGSVREGPDGLQALRPGDLTLDRAGPDPFDPSSLGPIVTVRWPLRVGPTAGAVRLWLPEPVVEALARFPEPEKPRRSRNRGRIREYGRDRRYRSPTTARRALEPLAGRGGIGRHVSGIEAAAGWGRAPTDRFWSHRHAGEPHRIDRPGPRLAKSGGPIPHPCPAGPRLGRPADPPRCRLDPRTPAT